MYVLLGVGVSRLRSDSSPKLVLDKQCLLYNLILGPLVCKRMFDNEKKKSCAHFPKHLCVEAGCIG